MVRFDDMIATVLARRLDEPRGRIAAWRQIVDLLAQGRHSGAEREAFAFLNAIRDEVPIETRRAFAAAIAGDRVSPALVGVFASDRPSVAAPLLAAAQLDRDDWLALLPKLGAAQRALLRHRRDLGAEVERALASFGPNDLIVAGPATNGIADENEDEGAVPMNPTIVEDTREPTQARTEPDPSPAAAPTGSGPSQIRDLLDRIESFRQARSPIGRQMVPPPLDDGFTFETDTEGRIVWVEGVPRGPLIGATIAVAAGSGEHGVDGQAAGAFRRRAPFRHARLAVAGQGEAGGDWRISAEPFFDPATGRFEGYHGTARRPRRDEIAGDASTGTPLFGERLAPDSLRQLVHELRTPLNAIQGFADMIEGQMLGPAPAGYRERAREIAHQARRLLGAVDDLDTAARIEGSRPEADAGAETDGTALLCRLHAEHLSLAREHDVDLRFTLAERLPPVALAAGTVERMFKRLLSATIGLAGGGETIVIGWDRDPASPASLRLNVSRPHSLAGLGTDRLLDAGWSPEGDFPEAPALGLGFALRLVANLARASGGRLAVGGEAFALTLPARAEPAAERGSA